MPMVRWTRILWTLSGLSYYFLVALAFATAFLSCISLLSQAVRNDPRRTWKSNYDTIIIGGAYGVVFVASILLFLNRRIAMRLRLQRISKSYKTIRKGDVPKPVHRYITQEYARSCLITHASQPHNVHHEGWGRPGTEFEDIRFRTYLMDTVKIIDRLAHEVLPSQQPLKPNLRMLHQFRFLLPLLPQNDDRFSALHIYDSAIEIARYSASEPSEEEFIQGFEAFNEIKHCLEEYKLGLNEEASSTQVESIESVEVS
ncbi:hypothetical protein DL96DRAFT_1809216 [Flagelloscypha sp. PMI_526]|nr:hypothetical protein DL96DRAFT_1809216 [Flagelloscypha sp. PMI_526]